jgi:hypothetical protein
MAFQNLFRLGDGELQRLDLEFDLNILRCSGILMGYIY